MASINPCFDPTKARLLGWSRSVHRILSRACSPQQWTVWRKIMPHPGCKLPFFCWWCFHTWAPWQIASFQTRPWTVTANSKPPTAQGSHCGRLSPSEEEKKDSWLLPPGTVRASFEPKRPRHGSLWPCMYTTPISNLIKSPKTPKGHLFDIFWPPGQLMCKGLSLRMLTQLPLFLLQPGLAGPSKDVANWLPFGESVAVEPKKMDRKGLGKNIERCEVISCIRCFVARIFGWWSDEELGHHFWRWFYEMTKEWRVLAAYHHEALLPVHCQGAFSTWTNIVT